MQTGSVVELFISAEIGVPMQAVPAVTAIAGRGLAGDRYAEGKGTFSSGPTIKPGSQVTLIEREAVEAVSRDKAVQLTAAETRRNIITSGVALNHCVGREFHVGAARLRGIKLCEPCARLESLTREGIRSALIHRGGLRAEVVEGGEIAVGDAVVLE